MISRPRARSASLTSRASRSIRNGLGYLSENRKEEGLLVDLSIADNVALSRYRPLSCGGWVSRRKQDGMVGRWLGNLSVRSRGPRQRVRDRPPQDRRPQNTPSSRDLFRWLMKAS